MSEHVLAEAELWSKRLGVPLWVVTAISRHDMRQPGYDRAAESNYVHRLANQVGAQWDVLHGADPARTIVDWAGPSLIAMTTHGRSGFSRFKMGSVTVGVTRWSVAPVLVANGHPGVRENGDGPGREVPGA